MEVKTPIIPSKQIFAKKQESHELNLEAICVFAAIGFFLDQDTYWKDELVLPPASINSFNSQNQLLKTEPWFHWHYTPRNISFNQALEEFSILFEQIINEQANGKKVILPLSGGLDSRTQAIALKKTNADVFAYSYQFENGYQEAIIAKKIAKKCDFEFKEYKIPNGYLWKEIDVLAKLNNCYSDFTAPRQMAIYEEYDVMGDVFSLGHWGDVLFNDMGVPEDLPFKDQVELILKKLVKKGGMSLAESLWESWNIEGNFKDYFKDRICQLLEGVNIKNSANAQIRAFKSLYWAPRWTSVNLSVFSTKKIITLPYYDNRMCEFICTIPEKYLANRQLQIEYIKTRSPELAKITWQDQRPFNLTNFSLNKMPYNLPYKIINKLKREIDALMGKKYVQRNWELQFVGKKNEDELRNQLFNTQLENLISKDLIKEYYKLFLNNNKVQYAHAINMLLVLSKFNQKNA